MEYLKNWFLSTMADAGMGLISYLTLLLLGGCWFSITSLEEKQWNLFIKIVSCLLLLFVTQVIINVATVVIFRFNEIWFFFLKPILEGALVPIVFFKAIPKQGKMVALIFVVVFSALLLSTIYNLKTDNVFTTILGLVSAIFTYVLLSKGILIEHDNN